MSEEQKDEKKIIIDEDWKQQAKKDKETLAAKEEAEKKQAEKTKHRELPTGDLSGLVSMLFTQTLYSLGFIGIKGQDKNEPDLALAKYNIEMLEMLEQKTKGNITDDEKQALTGALAELRMAFVKVAHSASTENPKNP
jgi:hypothetical protein